MSEGTWISPNASLSVLVNSPIFAVEVKVRDVAGARKGAWDLEKAIAAVLRDAGRRVRYVVVTKKRGASCNGLMHRLEACAGRRTAALTVKVPVPGIENCSKTVN